MNSEPIITNDMKIGLGDMLVDSPTRKTEDADEVGGTGLRVEEGDV